MSESITVRCTVKAPIEKVWELWNQPEHIIHWAFASDDWEAPHAENDIRVRGKFKIVMAAKDKSAQFDLTGTYTSVQKHHVIEYNLYDGRKVSVEFKELSQGVEIIETFEPEKENPLEMQRSGWQAILDNFKKYAGSAYWQEQLEKEGFTDVRVCPLPPDKDLPEHTHDEHTVHVILEGELTVIDSREKHVYKSGERVEFSAGTTHKARGTDKGAMINGVKKNVQKIIPHLWFDKEAKEAAAFYVSVFGRGSKIKDTTVIHDTPSGDCDIVEFELRGREFMAISAGPLFKFNPSISFFVYCETKNEVDSLWEKLFEGGKVLMPLQEYPWSKRYGWIQDKYGLSWQLILTNPNDNKRPEIVPSLLFVGNAYGKAEEAVKFYMSVFKQSQQGSLMRYSAGQEPNKEGTLMFADFKLLNTRISAMDGGGSHDFSFNEAVSFLIQCETQEEINYYWEKLSAVPEAEQCGWLRDKYGVSWQVNSRIVGEMLKDKDLEKVKRVTEAFLKMKKFDIAALKKAYEDNF